MRQALCTPLIVPLILVGCFRLCPPQTPYPYTEIRTHSMTLPGLLADGNLVAGNGRLLRKLSPLGQELKRISAPEGTLFDRPYALADGTFLVQSTLGFGRYSGELESIWQISTPQ